MRILLIEDDPALADTTSRALKAQGWSVDWSTRGEGVPASLRLDPLGKGMAQMLLELPIEVPADWPV